MYSLFILFTSLCTYVRMFSCVYVIQVGAENSVFTFSYLRHSEKYSHSDTISYYLRQCIMKFEGITNVQTIADVANQFLQR